MKIHAAIAPSQKHMMISKIAQTITVAALVMGLSLSASGQIPGQEERPDEVDQLAEMLDLTEDQQSEIRSVIDEISPKIEELQTEARSVQEGLREKAGPDFDEAEIRKDASKLGELTGEITALTIILQSTVHSIFTKEQRDKLEELERQQQQMQQQMQQQFQQQQQQQQQPQGEPPEAQQPPPPPPQQQP